MSVGSLHNAQIKALTTPPTLGAYEVVAWALFIRFITLKGWCIRYNDTCEISPTNMNMNMAAVDDFSIPPGRKGSSIAATNNMHASRVPQIRF